MDHIREWGHQSPYADKLHRWHLAEWLEAGDSIATATILIINPPGLLVSAPDLSVASTVGVRISGGVHGSKYAVTLSVATLAGNTDIFVGLIGIVDPQQVVLDQIGAGMLADLSSIGLVDATLNGLPVVALGPAVNGGAVSSTGTLTLTRTDGLSITVAGNLTGPIGPVGPAGPPGPLSFPEGVMLTAGFEIGVTYASVVGYAN